MWKRKLRRVLAVMTVGFSLSGAFAESLSLEQQINANYTLLTLELAQGDYEGAITYADDCLEMAEVLDASVLADIYLKKGYSLLALDRLDEAAQCLDDCLNISGQNAEAMLLRMQMHVIRGEDEAAMAQAEQYVSAYPDSIDVFSTLGELYAVNGSYSQAVEAYSRYLKEEGAQGIAYQLRGQYRLQLGQYAEAEEDLTRVIEDEQLKATPRAHYLRAIARMQQAKYADAAQDLDVCVEALDVDAALLAENPDYVSEIDSDVRGSAYYRGIARMQLGLYREAVDDFSRCISEELNADYGRFWRGSCYLDLGDYAAAESDFAWCQQQGIETDQSLYYMAVCKMGGGDYAAAVEAFTDCIEQQIQTQQALYNRGMCYLQLGEDEKGQADLEASLS